MINDWWWVVQGSKNCSRRWIERDSSHWIWMAVITPLKSSKNLASNHQKFFLPKEHYYSSSSEAIWRSLLSTPHIDVESLKRPHQYDNGQWKCQRFVLGLTEQDTAWLLCKYIMVWLLFDGRSGNHTNHCLMWEIKVKSSFVVRNEMDVWPMTHCGYAWDGALTCTIIMAVLCDSSPSGLMQTGPYRDSVLWEYESRRASSINFGFMGHQISPNWYTVYTMTHYEDVILEAGHCLWTRKCWSSKCRFQCRVHPSNCVHGNTLVHVPISEAQRDPRSLLGCNNFSRTARGNGQCGCLGIIHWIIRVSWWRDECVQSQFIPSTNTESSSSVAVYIPLTGHALLASSLVKRPAIWYL